MVSSQGIPAQVSSGLQTSSHSTRCEWWLMANSPVRHPWTLGYPRVLCLTPCCSCARSTIFPVLSNHKCISSWITVFSSGRFTLAKTRSSCSNTYTAVRDMGRTVGDKFNARKCCFISWVYAANLYLYSLENHILKQVPLIWLNPYFGVQLSENLSCSNHISTITKKSELLPGLIRINVRSCPEECRKTAL